MLPIEVSKTDIETIKVEKKYHKCPTVRVRLQVLWMLHLGFQRSDTALAVACSENTVTNVVKMYNAQGLEGVMRPRMGVVQHALSEKFDELTEQLKDAAIHTLEQGQEWLAEHFDYKVSHESVRKLFRRLGIRRRKVNPFPGNAKKLDDWLASQDEWIEHLERLHDRAKNEEIDMAFCDAAHFVYGKFCSYLWSSEPVYKATGSGRHRLNVYGAYDPVSGRVLTNYGEGQINAEYIVNFMSWLRQEHYTDCKRALHLMMDNARYQHCQYVKQEAEKLNIVLEFQPSYSPNLNLIERVWKYIKGLIGRCRYGTKQEFFDEIIAILDCTHESQHQEKLKTLLTMKFQTFENSQIQG